jgi:hypothetical protein
MNAMLKALVLTAAWLVSAAALAGEAVPVNATFGIQWTPENWIPFAPDNPPISETSSLGAAGLSNGKVLAVESYDYLDREAGTIKGQATLYFSYMDSVLLEYSGAAGFNPETYIASFYGPMTVVGGSGRFAGATGSLTIRSNILFGPFVGTFDIKGVIKTAQ